MVFTKKIAIYFSVCSALVGGIATWVGITYYSSRQNTDLEADTVSSNEYSIQRNPRNYKYISPIISIERKNESETFSGLRAEIESYISSQKATGNVSSASVYVRRLTHTEWFSINPNEQYNPGSLLKVGVLITYLRMAESDATLLEKEVVYEGNKLFKLPTPYYKDKTVDEGKKYTINELLEYMIKYSDNNATLFLENHMDTSVFKKEFEELGITTPRFDDPYYAINVKEYSAMLKALYNAGYLRKGASEKALAMLVESTFKEGLLKELPNDVIVAHKFGEAGDGHLKELHESGIIYIKNNPYIITVMTKGDKWDQLSALVGHVSKIVYDKMIASR